MKGGTIMERHLVCKITFVHPRLAAEFNRKCWLAPKPNKGSSLTSLGATPVITPLGTKPVITPLGTKPVFISLGDPCVSGAVVGVVVIDAPGAVEGFGDNYAHQWMRQGQFAQRPAFIRQCLDVRRDAFRSADDER